MCPVCIATTTALIAASITSTGGLAAILIRIFALKSATKLGAPCSTQHHRVDHGLTPSNQPTPGL
jgi:hypothetical protein